MIAVFQMHFLLVPDPSPQCLSKSSCPIVPPLGPLDMVCSPNLLFLPLLLYSLLRMTQSRGTNSGFSYQDQCDQRPATANNHVSEGIPRQDFQPRGTSPELPKRRVRHQGMSQGWAKAACLLFPYACFPLPICSSHIGLTCILNYQAQSDLTGDSWSLGVQMPGVQVYRVMVLGADVSHA